MKKIVILILVSTVSLSLGAWENYDWLAEYNWTISDGRSLAGLSRDHIYWHAHQIPTGTFEIFSVPPDSILFKQRLRKEKFFCSYQEVNDQNRIVSIRGSTENEFFALEFLNDFSQLRRKRNNQVSYGLSSRTGGQSDPRHPLVGIWGELPALNEFRIIEPGNYVYSFEIDEKIPGWAIRRGTYLFKQVGNKIYETDSSFPDGHLRLEIINETTLLITPLFNAPREEGLAAPLALRRASKRIAGN